MPFRKIANGHQAPSVTSRVPRVSASRRLRAAAVQCNGGRGDRTRFGQHRQRGAHRVDQRMLDIEYSFRDRPNPCDGENVEQVNRIGSIAQISGQFEVGHLVLRLAMERQQPNAQGTERHQQMFPQQDGVGAVPVNDVKRQQQAEWRCNDRPSQVFAQPRDPSKPVRLCQNHSQTEPDQARAGVDGLDIAQSRRKLSDTDERGEAHKQHDGSQTGSQEEQAGEHQIEEYFKVQRPAQQQQRSLRFKRRDEQHRFEQTFDSRNGGSELVRQCNGQNRQPKRLLPNRWVQFGGRAAPEKLSD